LKGPARGGVRSNEGQCRNPGKPFAKKDCRKIIKKIPRPKTRDIFRRKLKAKLYHL